MRVFLYNIPTDSIFKVMVGKMILVCQDSSVSNEILGSAWENGRIHFYHK